MPFLIVCGALLVLWVLARYVWFARSALPDDAGATVLTMSDGTEIAVAHVDRGREHVVIVAHGFLKRKDDLRIVRLASHLLERFDVLLYDQPGHGASSGTADLDFKRAGACLAAVVAEARRLGYRHVSAVGVSLGAAATIHAAASGAALESIVSISSPVGPAWHRDKPWRPGVLRYFYRSLGIRVADTLQFRHWPLDAVGSVAPCSILIVHCGRDTLIPRKASEALYRAASEPKAWLEEERAWHGTPNRSHDKIVAWLEASVELVSDEQVEVTH